jgi:hypothetical protein
VKHEREEINKIKSRESDLKDSDKPRSERREG